MCSGAIYETVSTYGLPVATQPRIASSTALQRPLRPTACKYRAATVHGYGQGQASAVRCCRRQPAEGGSDRRRRPHRLADCEETAEGAQQIQRGGHRAETRGELANRVRTAMHSSSAVWCMRYSMSFAQSIMNTLPSQSAAERLGDVPDSAVVVVDIAADGAAEDLAKAFDGANALVIASSAVRGTARTKHSSCT